MKNLTPEQYGRLKEEYRELTIKLTKLQEFLGNREMLHEIGATHEALLTAQYGSMVSYHRILELRLAIFSSEDTKMDELEKFAESGDLEKADSESEKNDE